MKLPDVAALRKMATEDLVTIIGQAIVREGGDAVDTNGNRIYSNRADARMQIAVYDPELKRAVHVMAKVRITIEREI